MYWVKGAQMSVNCKNYIHKIHLVLLMRLMYPFLLFVLSGHLFSCNSGETTVNKPVADTSAAAIIVQQMQDSTLADSVREQLIEKLVQSNQPDKAMEQVNRLLKKDSANPGWLYMKADALERMGDTAEAIVYYNRAVTSAGIFVEAEMRAANLFAETGNKNALILCDNLLKNQGAVRFRSDVLLMKGIYYTKVKNTTKALELFNQIIREDYSYMNAYIEKGLVYYDMAKYKDAWTVFHKTTEVSNAFADGYFWMAKTEEKLNKMEEAIANYKRSLALDQSLSEAREAIKRLEKTN
jgi:tetratricopeptide (TPR) repeat protein